MVTIKRTAFVIATLLLVAMTATPANNAEQVIFSTPGFCCMTVQGNSNGVTSTPLGFWIWCAAEAAANSQGGYQNAGACAGSMYFYALDHNATGIIGQVSESPVQEGVYTMGVAQGSFPSILKGTFDPSKSDYLCLLTNPSPPPTHTVDVQCLFGNKLGGGFGLLTHVDNAVVNVTGP
jgi:hypothetical protein